MKQILSGCSSAGIFICIVLAIHDSKVKAADVAEDLLLQARLYLALKTPLLWAGGQTHEFPGWNCWGWKYGSLGFVGGRRRDAESAWGWICEGGHIYSVLKVKLVGILGKKWLGKKKNENKKKKETNISTCQFKFALKCQSEPCLQLLLLNSIKVWHVSFFNGFWKISELSESVLHSFIAMLYVLEWRFILLWCTLLAALVVVPNLGTDYKGAEKSAEW